MWPRKFWHVLTRPPRHPVRQETGAAPPDGLAGLFLSYAREDDEPFVERLYRDLTERGFAVWWDRKAMENRGRTFLQEIRDAIESSDRVIAVIGPEAVASQYVRYEWEHAHLFSKGIVPVLRKGGYGLLPQELSELHCPDFRRERHYRRALAELVRILSVPVPSLGSVRGTPPLPVPFLIRRHEIARLVETITADVHRPVVVTAANQTAALHGMAGAGKSVLAAAVARATETRRAFEHGVVWLQVGPDAAATDPGRLLLQTIRELGSAAGNEELDAARAKLQQLLQHKVCLLVLDDVWDAAHVEVFRGALGPRCRLLFTSREGAIATAVGAHEHRLGPVSDAEAIGFLEDWTGERFDPGAAGEVAREVENLPFALALCGAMIREGVSWTDLAAALRESDMAFLDRQLGSYEHRNPFKALQVGMDFLSRSDPPAAEILRDLAVFPAATGIPEAAVVTLWLQRPGGTERDARRLLVMLERKALLRLEGGEPDRRVFLHALQYDYLRQIAGDLAPLHARLLRAYRNRGADGWATVPDDGYFHDHAAHHFIGAGWADDLYGLIEDRGWYEAKREVDPTLYSYVQDVKVALEWAGRREATDIPRIVAYSWLLSAAEAREPPVEALEAMVVLGRSGDALRRIEMVGDVHRYVWASRRLIELLVARGDWSEAREVLDRAVRRASADDEELESELRREPPPLTETLAALRSRNREQAPTRLRDLLQHYVQYESADPDALLEPDREFVLLSPVQHEIALHALAFGISELTWWWISRVDFPETACPTPTVSEASIVQMLPLLASTLWTRRVDRSLVRGTVAEILAEIGEAERALAVAAGVNEPLTRLEVMSLALRTFAARGDEKTVQVLWSELAELSTAKYAGSTPDRVCILMRVADACMHTRIAEEAMKKAFSLCTSPGLAEAVAGGRALDETRRRELAARRHREQLAEELFGGGGGHALVEAQSLLAEKAWRDGSRMGTAGAELCKSAVSLLERALRRLEEKMEDADRVKALCAVGRTLQAFGRGAESAAMLQRAENLAEHLEQSSRAQAMAAVAATRAGLGDTPRAADLLRRGLVPSEGDPDRGFRTRFLSACVKALIDAGDVDRALAMAGWVGDESATLSILGEAVVSLARSGREARSLELAEQVNSRLAETPLEAADPAVLTHVAIGFALAERTADARALLERAVAGARAYETGSIRLDALIRVVRALADAGVNDLAFEVCEKMDHTGTRAVLFAALLWELRGKEWSDADFANLFLWATLTGAEAGGQTYYCPIATLLAARALESTGREATIAAQIDDRLRELAMQSAEGDVVSGAEDGTEVHVTGEALTAAALAMLGGLSERDQEPGSLRVANALRIAAGLERLPREVLRETSLLRVWELLTAEAAKDVEARTPADEVRHGLRELGRRGGIGWLESHLEECVRVLAEDGLVDQTWQRIEAVTRLFSRGPPTDA